MAPTGRLSPEAWSSDWIRDQQRRAGGNVLLAFGSVGEVGPKDPALHLENRRRSGIAALPCRGSDASARPAVALTACL